MNQGTGRISAGGVDGNTFLAAGGADAQVIAKANLPLYNLTVTDPGHRHNIGSATSLAGPGPGSNPGSGSQITSGSATTGITVSSGGSGTALPTINPIQISGLTLIRAG